MNRFDTGSVSAYTPQSMQELAFTPMMKRSQHDEMSKNLAALDAIATDPLDVHQKEALRIKQEFEGKLGNLSDSLAEKGIDGVGKSDFYKLKKEHDDLIAPTGRIGEINASKIALNATKKHFFDTADKKIPQDVLERNWQEHLKKYTGYSDLEKTKIKDIDSIGAVGYQDIEADILRGKQLLGNTTDTRLLNSGAKIQHRPDLGGFIMVSGDGREITTTNDAQLNAYLKDMNSKWLEENGEGTKYNKFAGISSQNTLSRILNSADMMRDFKRDKSYNESQSFHQYPSSPKENNSNPYGNDGLFGGEDYNTSEIGGKESNLSELEKIGLGPSTFAIGSSPSVAGSGIGGYSYDKDYKGKTFSSNDIKDPLQKALYDKAWREMSSKQGMRNNEGKYFKLTEKQIKLGKDNFATAQAIVNQIKNSPAATYTDKIITTDIQYGANGFPQYANKDQVAKDNQVLRELQRGGNEGRKIVDPDTGEQYDLNKFLTEKGMDMKDLSTIKFQGIKSFDRIVDKNDYKGKNGSASSPLMVSIRTPKEGFKTYHLSRISSDNRGINPERMDEWQKNNKLELILNPNEFIKIKSKSKSLDGKMIRNNIGPDLKYDDYGKPLSYTMLGDNGEEYDMTSDEMLSSYIKTK